MYRKIVTFLGTVALAVGVSACGTIPLHGARTAAHRQHKAGRHHHKAARRHHKAASRHRHHRARPSGALRVLTEPAAGVGPIYRLIASARSSIELTIYELIDPRAEADLAAAAARGVDVRVILDQHFERSRNASTFHYLTAHGVHVHWGEAHETVHQKTLTVDGKTSAVMTLNLVAADYSGTRDFAVIDTNRSDIAAIVATFDADFAGRGIRPPDGKDLVWSPTNAQASVLSVIRGARHTLAVEDEEMADPVVTSALAGAARHGVRVTVVMTANSDYDQAFAELRKAGVHIRLYPDDSSALYIHAKAIVADAGRPDQRVLVGSQNFSVASLDYNRELSVMTKDRPIVAAISKTIAGDFAGAGHPGNTGHPGNAGHSGKPAAKAQCTATARVYNAKRHENDVYVHSNRPGREATASSAGYSHSYRTNSSGYAVIYLNGPRPGARITVRVGGATCTTRD